jgi:hypothetical protein
MVVNERGVTMLVAMCRTNNQFVRPVLVMFVVLVQVFVRSPPPSRRHRSADLRRRLQCVKMIRHIHRKPDRPVWLGRISSAMKSGAWLALIEFKEGKLPEGPPESAKIPRAHRKFFGVAIGGTMFQR